MEPDLDKIEKLVRELLLELGEDPKREGLRDTPKRVAKAFSFLTHGYRASKEEVINRALFTQDTSSMVIVKDIEVYSMCEHHMLPFFGLRLRDAGVMSLRCRGCVLAFGHG